MHPLIGLIQLLSIGFGLYLCSLIIYTMWGLTHPNRQSYAWAISRQLPGDPSELNPPIEYEEYTINCNTGKAHELGVWALVGHNPDGPCVVMTHGWGSSKQAGLKRIEPIITAASKVILWDQPGHGDSSGIAHLGANEHRDLARVIDSIAGDRPIVLYGWSMGAGVSLACAQQLKDNTRLAGVICESPYLDPFTPASNVIRLKGIPHRLNVKPAIMLLGIRFGVGPTWRGFARDQIAKAIELPMLILHGDADPVSPIEHGQAIAQGASNAKLVTIEGGGHNNLWTDDVYSQQASDAIESFMQDIEG